MRAHITKSLYKGQSNYSRKDIVDDDMAYCNKNLVLKSLKMKIGQAKNYQGRVIEAL